MSKWTDIDLPKGKEKHTKAMMYRSRQGLKKELKNIDSEYSKALCNIHRDLEQTRDTLKTLRITKKQGRLNYIKHKQETNFVSMPSGRKSPLQSLRRTSTEPLECDLSSKIVKTRQLSEKTVLKKMHSKKLLVMKLEGWKDDVNQQKQKESDEEENIQELEMDDKPPQKNELLDSTETVSTIFSPFEVGRNLQKISAESREDESKVEDTSILTIDQGEESGNESEEPSSLGSEDEQITVQETSEKQSLGYSWSNNDALPRGRHVRTRRASSSNIKFRTSKADQVLNKSKTGFSEVPMSSLRRIPELNQDNTITPREKILTRRRSSPNLIFIASPKDKTANKLRSLTTHDFCPPQQRVRIRRASSPSLMITAMPKDTTTEESSLPKQDRDQPPQQRARTRQASSTNLMFTATPKDTTAEKPSLKMQDLDQPPAQRVRTRRVSSQNLMFTATQQETDKQRSGRRCSIAVMTGVANSFVSEHPRPKFQVTSLPEPLTGAQLEKRLQAHRVDANVASSQTPSIAWTPEKKAPSELDMNDLEECRYIRRPIRK